MEEWLGEGEGLKEGYGFEGIWVGFRWVGRENGFGDRDGLGTGEGDELGRERALGSIDGFGEGDRFRGGDGFKRKMGFTYLLTTKHDTQQLAQPLLQCYYCCTTTIVI